jgi:glycosyltransferase involved in cell wall biosynthesis
MKQNIVFTVTNDLSFDQRMQRICSTLQDAGYNCTLVGRLRSKSIDLDPSSFSQIRLKCFFEKGKLFYLEYNIRLLFFLLNHPFDGVCSIDVDTAIPGFIATKLRRIPWVFDAHELFTEVPEVKDRKLVRSIWSFVQKLAFKHATVAYTVGFALAQWFENTYHRKVLVVRNAPIGMANEPYSPAIDKFILYQGALNVGRGLEALLHAMQALPCKLVIAGEGDLSAELRILCVELNVQEKVQFLGFVKPMDLKKLTAQAWIGMNVSENAGLSYYLSMNNKFFDYVHAGLPSLINPFPEYIKLNEEFRVGLITESTASDIVKNALVLLHDEELHHTLHKGCVQAAEALHWEKEKQVLIELYSTIFEKQ